ncbi:hypothetical protein V1264_004798 [Littorina saxatilis]|uniref:Uncharacterized protein n=1 Tax=Littorina saxatilis TaxID=31220 RepID=A0AAN9B293_9CAEN
MAEGPLPCGYKGLETDAHPPHYTTDEHGSGEGGISSSTKGSGGKDNGPHEYVSDNYSSVNSVDLLYRLSVNNPSLSTYESQAYRRTDSDSSFFEARNPSQPSKPVQCRRTSEVSKNRSNHVKTRIRLGASGSRHSEDCQHVKNQSQNNTRGDDTTEFTRQRGSDAFPAFDQPDTVHDQASSASGSGNFYLIV